MKLDLNSATLIKRYKRFLADVTLPNSSHVTTMHVANTGAMTGCADHGNTVFYSTSDNSKRKYPFSWEVSQNQGKDYICVNTLRANQLVEEALNKGIITELNGFTSLEREVKYGSENSRIDFLLKYESLSKEQNTEDNTPDTYIEVKSVTLLDENFNGGTDTATCNSSSNSVGQGYFPDAVSTRGQKHLRELMEMAQQGHQAVLLFAVLHSGINKVSVANHIDKKYASLLRQAQEEGVKILVYKATFDFDGLSLDMQLKESIDFN